MASLEVLASRIVARLASGPLTDVTVAELLTLINVEAGADVTDATSVAAAGGVLESDFVANSLRFKNNAAVIGNIVVAASQFVARLASGELKNCTVAEILTLLNVAAGAEVNPDLIGQAESEAGVATTERIFSALRVAQAITAQTEFSVLDRDSTTVSVNTTTVETTVYSFSVPADTLGTDKFIILKMAGTFQNNSGGSRLTTIRFKYGSTTFTAPARTTAGPASAEGFEGSFYITADGATNVQRGWMNLSIENDTTGHVGWIGGGTAAEDSTGALTLEVTVQHNFSSGSLDFVHEYTIAQLIG